MNAKTKLFIGAVLCNLFIFAGVWLIMNGTNLLSRIIGIIGVIFGEVNMIDTYNKHTSKRTKEKNKQ